MMLIAAAMAVFGVYPAGADDPLQAIRCNEDAMLVFDASGSMAGNERLGIGSVVTRIDKVRKALKLALPNIASHRRLGLITYGPGPYNRCDNINLDLPPTSNAGERIMVIVSALSPAGRTPLTQAVERAAEELKYRERPALIVLLTDGEETCGGRPCAVAKALKAAAKQLTIHVIGYRMKDFSWTGGLGIFETRCFPEETDGLYVAVETVEELVAALTKTLGCPMSAAAPLPPLDATSRE
ncbi:MAG: vWA domain-containing protein [Hyphomicrobium sp.]